MEVWYWGVWHQRRFERLYEPVHKSGYQTSRLYKLTPKHLKNVNSTLSQLVNKKSPEPYCRGSEDFSKTLKSRFEQILNTRRCYFCLLPHLLSLASNMLFLFSLWFRHLLNLQMQRSTHELFLIYFSSYANAILSN